MHPLEMLKCLWARTSTDCDELFVAQSLEKRDIDAQSSYEIVWRSEFVQINNDVWRRK